MQQGSVIQNIRDHYDTLTKAEKKVADYILKCPHQAVSYTIKDLSQSSGSSEATVVRTCKDLGYRGYWPFHIALASEFGSSELPYVDDENDPIRAIILSYASRVEAIANHIDTSAVEKAIELITTAPIVHIIAEGNTGTVAQHFSFRLGRLKIRNIFGYVAEYYINDINSAPEGDLLIVISQSGMSKNVVAAAELAKSRKLSVIAITAFVTSRLSQYADVVIESKGDYSRFDNYTDYSHICEFAVVDTICELIRKQNWVENSKPGEEELEIRLASNKF